MDYFRKCCKFPLLCQRGFAFNSIWVRRVLRELGKRFSVTLLALGGIFHGNNVWQMPLRNVKLRGWIYKPEAWKGEQWDDNRIELYFYQQWGWQCMNLAHGAEWPLDRVDCSPLKSCPKQGCRSDMISTEKMNCQLSKNPEKKFKWPDGKNNTKYVTSILGRTVQGHEKHCQERVSTQYPQIPESPDVKLGQDLASKIMIFP